MWQDAAGNGIQDSLEYPLANVTVELWQGNTKVGQAVTNANGEYYFGGASNQNIRGQESANAAAFSTTNNNISTRTTTSASVNWASIPEWTAGESGGDTTTPNLATIVQVIVNRAGWASGNRTASVLSNNRTISPNARCAETYDGSTTSAPMLVIECQEGLPFSVLPNTAYEVRVATRQAAVSGASLTTASAAQAANGNAPATDNNPITDVADSDGIISVSSSPLVPGSTVTFNIEVLNQGDAPANNVAVIDYVPAGYLFHRSKRGQHCRQ